VLVVVVVVVVVVVLVVVVMGKEEMTCNSNSSDAGRDVVVAMAKDVCGKFSFLVYSTQKKLSC
jgi:preprotein translocase subunit SecG